MLISSSFITVYNSSMKIENVIDIGKTTDNDNYELIFNSKDNLLIANTFFLILIYVECIMVLNKYAWFIFYSFYRLRRRELLAR